MPSAAARFKHPEQDRYEAIPRRYEHRSRKDHSERPSASLELQELEYFALHFVAREYGFD